MLNSWQGVLFIKCCIFPASIPLGDHGQSVTLLLCQSTALVSKMPLDRVDVLHASDVGFCKEVADEISF